MRSIQTILLLLVPLCLIAQQRHPVKIKGKWGLMDTKGVLVVEPVYDIIGAFDGAYAIIQQNGLVGLIDRNGKIILPANYDDINILNDFLFAVYNNKKWTVINLNRQTILDEPYQLLEVRDNQFIAYTNNEKWGMVHASGRRICAPLYDELRIYKDDYVLSRDSLLGLGLIDIQGKLILQTAYHDIAIHNDSLFFHKKGAYWGASSRAGAELLQHEWQQFEKLNDNFIVLDGKDETALYSSPARKVITQGDFHHFRVLSSQYAYCLKNGKTGLMDTQGNLLFPAEYDGIEYYGPNLFRVQQNRKWGVAQVGGEIIIPIEYDYIAPLSGNVATVRKNGLFGVVNLQGKLVIQPKYERISIDNNTAKAYLNEQLSILSFDETGEITEEDNFKKYGTIKIKSKARPTRTNRRGFGDEWEQNLLPKYEWYVNVVQNRWGLRERETGKIVIAPTYESIQIYRNLGFTLVSRKAVSEQSFDRTRFKFHTVFGLVNNDRGMLSTQLNIVDIRMEDITDRSLPAARCIFVDGRQGLISRKGGVIEDNCRWIGEFKDGRARASWKGRILVKSPKEKYHLGTLKEHLDGIMAGKTMESMTKYDLNLLREGTLECEDCEWGYIDTLGKIIIPPGYEMARDYEKGIALVKISGKWGMIDQDGGTLLDPEFDDIAFVSDAENQILRIVANREKYGVIDSTGKVIIEAVYDEVAACSEDRIGLKKGNKWAFADTRGKLITPFKYEKVQAFSEGLAAVRHQRKWGYINTNGDLVIEHKFRKVGNFREDMAWARESGSFIGYIDKRGNTVIKPTFHECFDFDNGMARVRVSNEYALINPQGTFILKPKYRKIEPFSEEGVAIVQLNSNSLAYGLIDRQGEKLTSQRYQKIDPLSDGVALVKVNNRFGYISSSGQEIITPKYTRAEPFKEGHGRFIQKGRWGFVNKEGQEVVPAQYSKCQDFEQGKAVVYMGYRNSGLIDASGNYFIQPKVTSLLAFTEGRGLVRTRNHQHYFITQNGSLYKGYFQDAMPFQYGVAPIKYQNRWGLLSHKGIMLIAPKFNKIFPFDKGYATVQVKRFSGIANIRGEVLLEPEYELIRYVGEGLLRIEQGNKIGYMDVSGGWVWALGE